MTKTQEKIKEFKKDFENIRIAIVSLRADMQVQTTDGRKGQVFSAVPTAIVEKWFKIIDEKYMDKINDALQEAEREAVQRVDDELNRLDGALDIFNLCEADLNKLKTWVKNAKWSLIAPKGEDMVSHSEQGEVGGISDTYHTFDELYAHRVALFIALSNTLQKYHDKQIVWKSKKHHDGTMFAGGWFIAGIYSGKGKQISYHLPIKDWDKLECPEFANAPEWDGHLPADVIERLQDL